ncbi:MAG: UTP--glucose-1-phosphate uridylyltransferase, partial [Verrucomicrobiota bacterium]
MPTVRKAVIPAAGLGTRFLPASAAVPKEMLPLGNRPALEWIIEEALEAGVTEIILVLSPDKAAVRRYFDGHPELIAELEQKGKTSAANALRRSADIGRHLRYVIQDSPQGLGHAVGCAEAAVNDEPFLILLGDAPILGDSPSAALCRVFEAHAGAGVLGVQRVPPEKIRDYGIVGGTPLDEHTTRLTAMVEKPDPADAPGNLAISGRYLLTPQIFDHLRRGERGKGNEIQLTDAMARLLHHDTLFAHTYAGT